MLCIIISLTVCDTTMSSFQMLPLASCAYHIVGVLGSVDLVNDFMLTSDPTCTQISYKNNSFVFNYVAHN